MLWPLLSVVLYFVWFILGYKMGSRAAFRQGVAWASERILCALTSEFPQLPSFRAVVTDSDLTIQIADETEENRPVSL